MKNKEFYKTLNKFLVIKWFRLRKIFQIVCKYVQT